MRLTNRTLRQMDSPIGANNHLIDQIPAATPLLNLSQGAPGFPPAPEVSSHIAAIARDEGGARYAPLLGLPELRAVFAAEVSEVYGGDVVSDDICITSGCNQAFCMVTSALAEPGDAVMLTLPYYFNHDMWLGLDGVTAQHLVPGDGIEPTVAEAEALLRPETRALVLVTPGNPTGHTIAPSVLAEFADFAVAKDIVLIVDETYRSFVPGGGAPHDLFTRSDWREHVVSLHSFSKDLAIPGHRVGGVIGHPDLLREVAKLIDCVTICASRVGQEAALAGLTRAHEWRTGKVAEIAAKQRRFEAVMAERPGGFELRSAGAYYGWVHHPFADEPTDELVQRMVLEQGVLVIPGTAFMPTDEQMLRFSFANVELDRIDELGPRLRAL